jgi:hypothetical protein
VVLECMLLLTDLFQRYVCVNEMGDANFVGNCVQVPWGTTDG